MAGETKNEPLEDEAFVCGAGAEFDVGAGDEFEAAGEIGTIAVTAGLRDECVSGEGSDAEAGPEDLPHCALIADLLLVEHEHLPEGFCEGEDVTDGGVLSALAGVQEAV